MIKSFHPHFYKDSDRALAARVKCLVDRPVPSVFVADTEKHGAGTMGVEEGTLRYHVLCF